MEKLIESILLKLNIDFDIDTYSGKADTYIIFKVVRHEETDNFDNENESDMYDIAIHYWTNKLSELLNWEDIKDTFKANGFTYINTKGSSDGQFKGKLMQFTFTK